MKIHNTTSKPRLLSYGVPQVSMLGSLLFTYYSAAKANIVRGHEMSVDDTQLYIVFDQDDAAHTIRGSSGTKSVLWR